MVGSWVQRCLSTVLTEKPSFSLVFVQKRLVGVAVKKGGGETMGNGWVFTGGWGKSRVS